MSKTKIQLEYPYNQDWKCGYVVTNPEGRKTLILWNSSKDRSSTQYARYLLAVHLGRYLTKDETVDHIDGNKQNDDLNNLQILSLAENTRKTHCKPPYELDCPICGIHFTKPRSSIRNAEAREKALNNNMCCSLKCARIKTSQTLKEYNKQKGC